MTASDRAIQTTIATYDRIASTYAPHVFDFSLEAEIDRFAAYLRPGGLILDVGSGSGRDVLAFQQRGFRAIGLDRSAGMLREAARLGAGPLVLADSRRLPFAKGTVNGVWASASLLHLPKADMPVALKEVNRVLRHGHVYLSLRRGQTETWREEDGHRRFFSYYHPAEVELALERAAFHVLDVHFSEDVAGRDDLQWINVIGWTKLETPGVGGCAVIFDEAGRVLLTRRADNGQWCVPGGHMDMDENIQQTAVREAKEETGLDVEIERLSGMYSVHHPASVFPDRGAHTVFIVAFRCKALGGQLTLNEEVTEFGWFESDNLPPDLLPYHVVRIRDAA